MGFSSKRKGSGGDNCGSSLLLVFFSDENSTSIVDKTELFAPSPLSQSPSPASSPSLRCPIRRSNSNPILSKAQFTISICFLIVCVTFLLFTLSTFEPTADPQINPTRRFKLEKFPARSNSPVTSSWLREKWRGKSNRAEPHPIALKGMGTLYRRGTRATSDLVVGHLVEDVTDGELRWFLRLLHRSGLTARADLVLVFDSLATATRFGSVIEEENDSFLRLIDRYRELNQTTTKTSQPASFDVSPFVNPGKTHKETGEPLWGKKTRSNYSGPGGGEGEAESTRLRYGSVVSFDVTELDPENSLSGLLNHVPMSLRRWAAYPMLLGRVKRNFKHTMLVDVKNFLVLGDPLGRLRNRSSESVYLSTKTQSSSSSFKHSKKSSDKTQSHGPFNSGLIIGSSRGVRRLSNAMVTEIARAAISQHKNPVTESEVLSQLGSNEMLLKSKKVNLVTSTEPVQDANQLNSGSNWALSVIHRSNGNRQELSQVIMKQICAYEVDSSVYGDC